MNPENRTTLDILLDIQSDVLNLSVPPPTSFLTTESSKNAGYIYGKLDAYKIIQIEIDKILNAKTQHNQEE